MRRNIGSFDCASTATLAAALAVAHLALAPRADAAPTPPTLPAPLATPPTVRMAVVVGWPEGAKPTAPAGFGVVAFARGLDNPRNLLVLPNGDVLVSEARSVLSAERRRQLPPELVASWEKSGGAGASANRITLLRDTDKDGVADLQTTLIDGLNQPYGMAIRRDRLYIANTDAVVSCPFFVGQTKIQGACRKLLDLPADGYNNHWTRNIVFAPDESRFYVSVGSATNVDEEKQDEKDPRRAAILSAKPDGTDMQIHATGLRNPVGLAFEPVSGALWTTVNERDQLGDDLVPDYMTAVKKGAFYGWPYAYFGPNEDPRKKGERPDLVAKTLAPDLAFDAHSASLGLAFYRRTAFPKEYLGGAFVAQRGSWNRSRFTGYRVVFVPFAKGRPAADERDFLTGFVKDEASGEVYGRPAGVAVARDGALLVADDAGNTIWSVYCSECVAASRQPAAR